MIVVASRVGVIAAFAAVGFAIGFMAFLASPSVAQWLIEVLPTLTLDPGIVFATITGAAGALISTVTVTVWAKRS